MTILLALLFMFTIVDFGIAVYLHHTLVQRTRTAVRKAVVERTYNESTIRKLITYGSMDGTDPFLGPTDANVNVVRQGTIDQPGDRWTVTVSGYRFPLFTYLVAGSIVCKPIVIDLAIEDNEFNGTEPI